MPLTVFWNMPQFEDKHHSGLLKMLADQLQCSPADIVDFELNVCDTQDGVIGGMAFMFRPCIGCPALSFIYIMHSGPTYQHAMCRCLTVVFSNLLCMLEGTAAGQSLLCL